MHTALNVKQKVHEAHVTAENEEKLDSTAQRMV
jgi:hypothetical protein